MKDKFQILPKLQIFTILLIRPGKYLLPPPVLLLPRKWPPYTYSLFRPKTLRPKFHNSSTTNSFRMFLKFLCTIPGRKTRMGAMHYVFPEVILNMITFCFFSVSLATVALSIAFLKNLL